MKKKIKKVDETWFLKVSKAGNVLHILEAKKGNGREMRSLLELPEYVKEFCCLKKVKSTGLMPVSAWTNEIDASIADIEKQIGSPIDPRIWLEVEIDPNNRAPYHNKLVNNAPDWTRERVEEVE